MKHKRKHQFRKSARGQAAPTPGPVATDTQDRSQMDLLSANADARPEHPVGQGTVAEAFAQGNAEPVDAGGDGAPEAAGAVRASTPSADAAEPAPADGTPADPVDPRDIRFRRDREDRGEADFGARLRAAREQRGWSQTDVGARLKLPIRLIERLENDDYAGMTQGVYLRGYLTSYARLVDLPVEQAEQVAEQHVEPVPLVATGTTSHSRYLFDRYSVSATYLILTALIVAPAVWLATHGGLEQNLARNLPLDGALVAMDQPARAPSATDAAVTAGADEGARRRIAVDPPPIVSSIASFPTMHANAPSQEEIVAQPIEGSEAGQAAAGDHRMTLRLSEESWVEVLDADGQRIEYGLLPAGTDRSYRADGPLSVHLGNADGATVIADGTPVELAPHQRANVVRLTLFDAGPERGSSIRN